MVTALSDVCAGVALLVVACMESFPTLMVNTGAGGAGADAGADSGPASLTTNNCRACSGSLSGRLCLSVGDLSFSNGSTSIKACDKNAEKEKGVIWAEAPPPGARGTSRGPPRPPSKVYPYACVGDSAIALISRSGFDLRDGVTLALSLSSAVVALDLVARTEFQNAYNASVRVLASPFNSLKLPPRALDLRDSIRALMTASLSRIVYSSLPADALVLSVGQAAESLRVSRAAALASAAAIDHAHASADATSAALTAHPALVKLGAAFANVASPDPRLLLAAASVACQAAFADEPCRPPTVFFSDSGCAVPIDAGATWVALGSAAAGNGGGDDAAGHLLAAGGVTLAQVAAALALSSSTTTAGGAGVTLAAAGLPLRRRLALLPTSTLTLTLVVDVAAGTMSLARGSYYIKGRYCKHLRGLSQTPWFVNGERRALSAASAPGDNQDAPVAPRVDAHLTPKGVVDGSLTSVEELLGAPLAAAVTAAALIGGGLVVGLLPHSAGASADVDVNSPLLPVPEPTDPRALAALPLFTFHAAGREDVDVRMLGTGRPFVIELAGARGAGLPLAAFAALGVELGSGGAAAPLRVHDLAPTSRAEFAVLQTGADSKRKSYVALAWSSVAWPSQEALDAALKPVARGVALAQRTPIRVLHRRSLLTRSKKIHSAVAKRLSPHFFLLHMVTSAGT